MLIVLFGSTGMLGKYVYQVLKEKYNVICVLRKDYNIENDNWSKLELQINKLLEKGDIIINCAGIIPQKYTKDNYKTFIKINTLFPHKLNEISIKNDYKFIHITTDCVFDGIKGNYYPYDIHTSTDIYGISKSLGEPEEATIIRTSIIGEELFGKKSLIEWVKSNKNGNIKGYNNHHWNGVTCLELSKFIKNMIDNNNFWRGIKHIFSPDIVTKYELCCYINEIYKLNINIEKYNDIQCKNMTLNGNNKYIINNILFQLKEQYECILE